MYDIKSDMSDRDWHQAILAPDEIADRDLHEPWDNIKPISDQPWGDSQQHDDISRTLVSNTMILADL